MAMCSSKVAIIMKYFYNLSLMVFCSCAVEAMYRLQYTIQHLEFCKLLLLAYD